MAVRVAPCGWNPAAPCNSGPCCPDVDSPENAIIKAQAELTAAAILWRLTGLQFGCCEVTVRPCKPETCDPLTLSQVIYWDQRWGNGRVDNLGVLNYFPNLIDGQIYNISCGCPTGCCTCKADCEVRLPGPICSVENVTIDGVELDESLWTVYDNSRLVFTKGFGPGAHVSRLAISPTGPVHDPSERVCFSVPVTPFNTTPDGPCYVSSGVSNMSFDVGSQLTYDFDYTVDAPFQGSVMAITNGGVLPTDVYTFPPNVVMNPGDTALSDAAADGSKTRVTIISGTTTTNGTGRFILSDDVSMSFEFLVPSTACPPCQNYNLDLGEVGTWSVTYTIGVPVPPELDFAAGLYACEIAKLLVQDKSCVLPARVQSVSRQGIGVKFLDPDTLIEKGMTGLPLVDQIVKALNPYGLRQPSRVWYPGMPKTRTETL